MGLTCYVSIIIFQIRDFNPVILKPGQNKTLFRVGYVNPNNSKMDIISYLEFKTNASDFTIPLMVYDGQLSQVCKLNRINRLLNILQIFMLTFTQL